MLINQTHNTDATRKQIGQLYDPQFIDMPDYDSFIQIVFDDIQDFVNFQADPEFIKNVAPDHTNFHDPKRTRYVYPATRFLDTNRPG
jgi:hypothetical protein